MTHQSNFDRSLICRNWWAGQGGAKPFRVIHDPQFIKRSGRDWPQARGMRPVWAGADSVCIRTQPQSAIIALNRAYRVSFSFRSRESESGRIKAGSVPLLVACMTRSRNSPTPNSKGATGCATSLCGSSWLVISSSWAHSITWIEFSDRMTPQQPSDTRKGVDDTRNETDRSVLVFLDIRRLVIAVTRGSWSRFGAM